MFIGSRKNNPVSVLSWPTSKITRSSSDRTIPCCGTFILSEPMAVREWNVGTWYERLVVPWLYERERFFGEAWILFFRSIYVKNNGSEVKKEPYYEIQCFDHDIWGGNEGCSCVDKNKVSKFIRWFFRVQIALSHTVFVLFNL